MHSGPLDACLWWFMVGGGEGDVLSKNVGHYGWPTTTTTKKTPPWLKRPNE